jgi:subtilisin family serine protease
VPQGDPIRVATIDSGVNPAHPHVVPIAGGVRITSHGSDDCYTDLLGHGTAVAGAIREKAPTAEIYAVKVFDRTLATTGAILLRALDWCLDKHMDFVNLSLGTLNASYRPAFEERIVRARQLGCTIVAAYEIEGRPAFPGSLAGVAGVVLAGECPRDRYRQQQKNGRIIYSASGYPRDIPGVPPRYNLQGISFAVANVTGFLAAKVTACLEE